MLDYARAHALDELILVGDEAIVAGIAGPLPGQRPDRPRGLGHRHGRAPGPGPRRKKDSSIVVATELVKAGQADAVVTAGHTGAGMAAGEPAPRVACRASTGRPSRSR